MLDEDELLYVDFDGKRVVWESRVPTIFHQNYTIDLAVSMRAQCRRTMTIWNDTSVTKTKAAPKVLLYPKDHVTDQINNTLVCFITHFFPPIVKIHWTKNADVVTSDDPFEKMIPDSEGTFQVYSSLTFVPKHGDIYSCMVEHETLKEPEASFYEVNFSGTEIGPTLYCIISITLAIIGFTTGMFFFVKGYQHQTR